MSESSRLDPYIPRIPILATAGQAFLFLFVNAKAFLVCAVVPLILSEMIWFPSYFLAGGFWGWFISDFLYVLPFSFFAVTWCRYILLGSERAPPRFLSRWSPRHRRVAAIQILALLIMMAVGEGFIYVADQTETQFGLFGSAVYYAVVFFFTGITLRIKLAQASATVDVPLSISRAWDLSRQQGLRLLLAALLVMTPVYLGQNAANAIFEVLTGLSSYWSTLENFDDFDRRYIIISLVNALCDYLWAALVLLVLCFSFRRISGWEPPTDPSVLERFE